MPDRLVFLTDSKCQTLLFSVIKMNQNVPVGYFQQLGILYFFISLGLGRELMLTYLVLCPQSNIDNRNNHVLTNDDHIKFISKYSKLKYEECQGHSDRG